MAMNKVKINSDVELKDRLVAINRVTKVTLYIRSHCCCRRRQRCHRLGSWQGW